MRSSPQVRSDGPSDVLSEVTGDVATSPSLMAEPKALKFGDGIGPKPDLTFISFHASTNTHPAAQTLSN